MTWPLALKPYDVQAAAFERGKDKECYAYWLEQGLGKTALGLADFLYNLWMERCEALIVIAPHYLMSEWVVETKKYDVKVPLVAWPDLHPKTTTLGPAPFILVINIEAVRTGRGHKFVEELLKRYRCMLMIDESTIIKSFNKLSARAALALGNSAKMRRELSGLPMPHNVMDLWSQLRFIKQLSGVNPYAFRNRYAIMGGYMGKQVKGIKPERLDELTALMDAACFRALKADWAPSLPPKIYVEQRFDLTPSQRKHYRQMEEEFFIVLRDGDPDSGIFANQVMHAMLKLQQISRGFILDGERVAHELVSVEDNPAINTIKAKLETIQGKTLIFTAYRHSTELLHEILKDEYGARMLIGGMKDAAIQEEKARFNQDPAARVFVLQTAVGHKGHTLLGGKDPTTHCSSTIYYENTYNWEHRAQSEDRNHRWGTIADCVTYTDLVCSNMDLRYLQAFREHKEAHRVVVDVFRTTRDEVSAQ